MNNQPVFIKCPLCGFGYDRTRVKCTGCPMSGNCHVLCCPHCGYQTVDDTNIRNIVAKIRSFFVWVNHRISKMKSWNRSGWIWNREKRQFKNS